MAKPHQCFFFLLLIGVTATVSATFPWANTTDRQLNNIIDAMIGSADFSSWENMISSGEFAGVSFSVSATFFLPSNDFRFPLDPVVFPYHIVPQRLSFSDLLLLKPLSRLPTLLPSKSILVTNTSAANFTLDNSPVLYPDLYLTSTIAVHGIENILNYSVYGGTSKKSPTSPPPPPPPLPPSNSSVDEGEIVDGETWSSGAATRAFPLLFSVAFFKIYGNLLGLSSFLKD